MDWFLNDDEVDGSNVAIVPHADPQEEEASQRSLGFQISLMMFYYNMSTTNIETYEEPVSNMTSKDTAGVPTANVP